MYAFTRKQADEYKTLAVAVALVYLAITSAVPFLHSDDCPLVRETGADDTSFPSDSPCPACKFLAGSNSTEAHCDSNPVLIEPPVPSESAADSVIVVANPCPGSIFLRAPPATSLS